MSLQGCWKGPIPGHCPNAALPCRNKAISSLAFRSFAAKCRAARTTSPSGALNASPLLQRSGPARPAPLSLLQSPAVCCNVSGERPA